MEDCGKVACPGFYKSKSEIRIRFAVGALDLKAIVLGSAEIL